jgi:Protein of unknown function (DUF3089)
MVTIALALALAAAQPAAAPAAPDYARDNDWLCLPGREDACSAPLPTADLNPNGYGPVVQSRPAVDARVDCFFVYPTVSRDQGLNSDLDGQEERFAATILFARFASLCRPFAPMYRSVTNAAIGAVMLGRDIQPNLNLAYEDVRSAWRQFLAIRNRGRPFVLIGHSQGSIHLQRLIQEEIEGKPIARRMVSAIIPGWNVEVPAGQAVGGTFRSTPICQGLGQTGCVVSYVSFRAETPPPASGGLFGRAARPGMTVACVNPATLAAGRAPLESYWYARSSAAADVTWSSTGAPPAPFLHTNGLASGECVHDGPVGYLAVRAEADPADARTDRIPGDLIIMGRPAPDWGLHLIDIPEAQGDLMRLLAAQIRALPGTGGRR